MEGRLQSTHDNSINPSMTELHYVVPDRFQPPSKELEGMCREIKHTLGLESLIIICLHISPITKKSLYLGLFCYIILYF